MKKIYSLILCLVSVMCFCSCSEDGDDGNYTPESIVGKWEVTHIKESGVWEKMPSSYYLAATLYEDGRYYGEGALGTMWGTYTIKDKLITTYYSNGTEGYSFKINALSGNQGEVVLMYKDEVYTEFKVKRVDGNDDEGEGGNNDNFNYPLKSIYGKWEAIQINRNGDWENITYNEYMAATFYEDGRYYGEGALGTAWGSYKAIGNKIITYVQGSELYTYTIKSLTGNKAHVVLSYKDTKYAELKIEKQ